MGKIEKLPGENFFLWNERRQVEAEAFEDRLYNLGNLYRRQKITKGEFFDLLMEDGSRETIAFNSVRFITPGFGYWLERNCGEFIVSCTRGSGTVSASIDLAENGIQTRLLSTEAYGRYYREGRLPGWMSIADRTLEDYWPEALTEALLLAAPHKCSSQIYLQWVKNMDIGQLVRQSLSVSTRQS